MHLRLITLAFMLLFSLTAWTQTTLKEESATGYGDTYQKALAAALFNAVNQSKGLTVHSEKQLRVDLEHLFSEQAHSVKGSIGVEEQIFTLSKGWIDSYRITNTREPKDKDGNWSVSIMAKIPHHETSVEGDTRKRIAVMPFRFAHSTYAIDQRGNGSNAYQLSQRIRDRILTNLTQSQQLLVLNRNFTSDFTSEKALLSSDNVPPREAARLGQVAGADYMVVGNIHKLQTETETKDFYGMKKTTMTDKIDLSYQLIEVASQKVEWADTIKTEVPRKDEESTDDTLDHVAKLVTASVLDLLFPIKVLDIAGADQIYLNQGQARLQPGSELALYTNGRTLTDPDTGIEIKIDGKKVATLVVEQAEAKYSIARLKEGQIDKVKKGDVVRQLPLVDNDPHAAKEVRETPGSSEAPVNW